MPMSPRANWMAQVVSDAFDVSVPEAQEALNSKDGQRLLERFFAGDGLSHVFVYYQKPYRIDEDTGEVRDLSSQQEFVITDGSNIKLRDKGIYFVRTNTDKPINEKMQNDDDVLFGEVSEQSVTALNTTINSVFKPLVDNLSKSEWGVCEDEQKREFGQVFEKFANELSEALRSIQGNIQLDPYPSEYEDTVKQLFAGNHRASEVGKMVDSFLRLLDRWFFVVQDTLDGQDVDIKDQKDAGPRQELDYWKMRMRKLTGISEQLRSKNCRTVHDSLSKYYQLASDTGGRSKDSIYLQTSKWRAIELRVTEALNEAKDNVKYLQTLEKFIEPLDQGTPESIKDILPALMNSIKMIHTIARYYNTNEQMTGLLAKITTSMIKTCKKTIMNLKFTRKGEVPKKGNIPDDQLWEHENYPPDDLIPVLNSCIELNEAYQHQYNFTKERLMNMPKGKQFDFSTQQIFGRFDLFCRRVRKLKNLFGTIQQFRTLGQHKLENIEPIIKKFNKYVQEFKRKSHRLLDFSQQTFDRDFVAFNVSISMVENDLQAYIQANFERDMSILDYLKLLRKFKSILRSENLAGSLTSKYQIVFQHYGREIHRIERIYQDQKSGPTQICRNMPSASGAIAWARHLFNILAVPMEQFPQSLITQTQSKKFVKQYNKVGYTLFSYEYLWRQKWVAEVDKAKAGLQATLIIRHLDNNRLMVNFDEEILTLIREAKCLSRIGSIDIPESAKIVLLQEDKFKMYKNELDFVLNEHDRIFAKIRPNTKSLLVPHQEDLEYKLRPGMVTLTWTSMNIDGYLAHVHAGLAKLEQLIININDIMENRIENNLKALSKTVLVNLPQDAQTFTLEEFVEMQEEWIKEESEKLRSKNQEVEGAVEDLIQMICSYQLDQHVEPISAEEIQKLSKYYNWSMYQALLHATKYSLNLMKERICGRRNAPKQVLKPFFEVEVRLEGSLPVLKPSMNEVQMAINSAARHVLKSTKNVQNWCQKNRPEEERDPFYTWIAKDKEIVKVILLLTGSIRGTENAIEKFLEEFKRYEWLFKERIDDRIRKFNQNNPQLEDFEAELLKFSAFEDEIDAIAPNKQIGALNLQTLHVKNALKERITLWKTSFARDLHKKASAKIEDLKDDMKQIRLKIEKPAADVDSLGNVMHALEDIRKRESQMDIDFRPVIEMYRLLDIYIPEIMAADETDPHAIIDKQWRQLVGDAGAVRDELMTRQANFKQELIAGIQSLTQDVAEFRENFILNGPMLPGIAPREALNRLRMFSDEYGIRKRRYDSYNAGEILFGLPNKEYPELTTTEQQLALLQLLYSLYQKVNDTIARWKEYPWSNMREEHKAMEEAIEQFIRDCGRLPKQLRKWEAYQELKTELENMEKVLPLVNALAAPAIRPRHWEEIIELTATQIPYADEAFSLQHFLDAPILDVQEDVEVIADNAEKQLKLEKDLNGEIGAYWEKEELTILPWKGVDAPCTIGGNVIEINEMLDDHLMKLNQMAAMRYVTPFKAEVQAKSGELALVQETLDKWIKIQALWVNLVPVFTGGDIAMSLPAAAKKFKVIDKQWLKLMERAHEQKNVVRCCKDDILQQSLPQLGEDLNFCEKQLADFLEDKRGRFPRFYFVANTDLLTILSVGSDPTQLQDDFEKMFDAIKRVSFDEQDRFVITEITFLLAGVREDVPLQEPVRGEGNIEDYLQRLEKEMMRSVKVICHSGAQDIVNAKSIPDYCRGYVSQVALLGIQMIWNIKMTECLEKPQKEKIAEFGKKLKEVKEINFQLSDMCLDGAMDKIQRTKIETCVTINVRQQEITTTLVDLVKRHAIKDPNDFEWQRNSRVSWDPDVNDVLIKVTDVTFVYQYEFLGAKERLCITPLTDKCYVTLAQALGMNYGGAPAGPAGTGKTETVKDLSCTLATYIVVTNCAPEHKFKDMATIFKGLSMSGAWGCFDEFNRISLPTLSVVAAQVASINNAKKLGQEKFMFPGESKPIKLIRTCGYFITMNPGYAGRQELPENLKVLFRGVCMMIPDRRVIIKVKLASQGFKENDMLSLKFHILYQLCEQQLTKTRHYDFGLRNILSVLRGSGSALRKQMAKTGTASEQKIMATTLRDMNLAKFIAQDVPLFLSLIDDIFPKVSRTLEAADWRELEAEIVKYLKDMNLAGKEVEPGKPNPWYTKVIQLHEQSMVRHGFMLVGSVGSGKSTIMKTLVHARTQLKSDLMTGDGQKTYKTIRMNPKAITAEEMYGVVNPASNEWQSGVFAEIWKRANAKSSKNHQWIVCDGPVDAIWIENLNTVLDDNKILTLANAERIPMSVMCRISFEVSDLNNASPATVSRCGIVYVSPTDLAWKPLVLTWCKDRAADREQCSPDEPKLMADLTQKYIEGPDMFKMLKLDYFYNNYDCPEVVCTTMLLNLVTSLVLRYVREGKTIDKATLEKIYVFCLAWSAAGLCEQEDREKFHKWLESRGAPLPNIPKQQISSEKETIFDYWLDQDSDGTTVEWQSWKATDWTAPKKMVFSQLLVPTSDSTRTEYVVRKISELPPVRSDQRGEPGPQNSLLIGSPGTAKTSCIIMYSMKFDLTTDVFKRINFSSATLPGNFQENIESEIVKKSPKKYHPAGGKTMHVFVDDISMPMMNKYLDQPTLEIVRFLIENRALWPVKEDRGILREVVNLKFLGAMTHPGGGRNSIPNRLKRHFFSVNLTPPSQKAIVDIYGKILNAAFNPKKYSPDVVAMKEFLIEASIEIWTQVRKRLLVTPTKFHYTFTIRELSRVFQGICQVALADKYEVIKNCSQVAEKIKPELFLIGLWRHECERVFSDKLVSLPDKKIFQDYLDRVTKDVFRDKLNLDDEQLITSYQFAIFLREDQFDEDGELVEAAPLVYEAGPSTDEIRIKAETKLGLYNEKFPAKKMNLVLFDDALGHLLRITRVINMPGGNAMLVGVGGSGKQSMTRLAAYICKHRFFQIALTKTYNENNLKDNIRELYDVAGPQGKSVAFVMTDAEVKKESFLEAINSMLATGEIPGLIAPADKDTFALQCKALWQKDIGSKAVDPSNAELWTYFLTRVKDNLHMILAFSPVGNKFRERSQKFPSLFSTCAIDWFLSWPEEALVSVARNYLSSFAMDATDEVRASLELHMGRCHDMVNEMCDVYDAKMRRKVFVTPKSYLSFIELYKQIYAKRFADIDKEEQNIVKGLDALEEAADGVKKLEVKLQKDSAEVNEKKAATDKLLHTLTIEAKKAKEKSDEVNETTIKLRGDQEIVMREKEEAQIELDKAMPFLERATAAVDSIKKKDVDTMAKASKAHPITMFVLDAMQILFYMPLDIPCKVATYSVSKFSFTFAQFSYDTYTQSTLRSNLMGKIQNFSEFDRSDITPEQVELLDPIQFLKFDPEYQEATKENPYVLTEKWTSFAASAVVGMGVWAVAMREYHLASKIVKPRLEFLKVKEDELAEAQTSLAKAEADLQEVERQKASLKAMFDKSEAEKAELEARAAATKKQMDAATRLINSLKDNKVRWIANRNEFKSLKKRLAGDVAKACAFVSYCGPFNSEYRGRLLDECFHADLEEKQIPVSGDMEVTSFFVTHEILGRWAMEGLPADDLSIQNGIMVTRSSRFPLMIDPQGQALSWIMKREPKLSEFQICIQTLANPRLRDDLKMPLSEGYPVLIQSVENEVDPMLDPILEKQVVRKGRAFLLKLGDQDFDYDEKFQLYMTSRLANPLWSPELAAKTTIIDFTVTQSGLEQQLLSRLIAKEQRQLEEQLDQLNKSVVMNKATLQELEEQLLDKLASVEGSLLDDPDILDVLSNIKSKSREVSEKLAEAAEKTADINERRELFRPVAARGAVLYFCIVEMAGVEWMYNTSLGQFLGLFYEAIDTAEKAQIIKDRVNNITEQLTMGTYRYINRGLFERHKATFKLMVSTRIMTKDRRLTNADVNMFLKAGQLADDKTKLFNWMEMPVWLNLKALSKHKFPQDSQAFFKALPDQIQRAEQTWQKWIGDAAPETVPVPDGYEEKLQSDAATGKFMHMCLVRCLREDRTLIAAEGYIADTLGPEFVQPVTDTTQSIWEESRTNRPVLFLLAPGSDPVGAIDELARKKKLPPPQQVSMGEGQEEPAQAQIDAGFVSGQWVILSNCHLALEYMTSLEDVLNPQGQEIHEDFRLWLTCAPANDFPLGLLQMAIKVTTEPPSGLRAGLSRTFNTVVNQDFLEKVEPYDKWKAVTWTLCFMHSIVQERRKFGALGFSKPYEFNTADLEASLTFCEGHMTRQAALNNPYSWSAMQYMIAWVQYGGRITEAEDQYIFNAYVELWVTDQCLTHEYCFVPQIMDYHPYQIPAAMEHQRHLEAINKFKSKDIPAVFGLNNNADLTFRMKESSAMISTLLETMPKDAGGGSGKSLNQEVQEKVEKDYAPMMPGDIVWLDVVERLKALRGPRGLGEPGNYDKLPLNVFLSQELQRMSGIMKIVKTTFSNIVMAINGDVIMTPEIVDAINCVADLRVPRPWCYDPSGAEISWLSPSLPVWIRGLIDRHHQIWQWIQKERPPSFWLTGFFNPTGFLTSMKQEVTRQKKTLQWSLDEVEYMSEVTKDTFSCDDGRSEGHNFPNIQEGVLIHGLYLEGAGWHVKEERLDDAAPGERYYPFPVMKVSAVSVGKPEEGKKDQNAQARTELANRVRTCYRCPLYRYPGRRMPYLIETFYLKADSGAPSPNQQKTMTPLIKWRLCGTALLCSKV